MEPFNSWPSISSVCTGHVIIFRVPTVFVCVWRCRHFMDIVLKASNTMLMQCSSPTWPPRFWPVLQLLPNLIKHLGEERFNIHEVDTVCYLSCTQIAPRSSWSFCGGGTLFWSVHFHALWCWDPGSINHITSTRAVLGCPHWQDQLRMYWRISFV